MNKLLIKFADDTELFQVTDYKEFQKKTNVKLATWCKIAETFLLVNAR